jgi:hypothetical protein
MTTAVTTTTDLAIDADALMRLASEQAHELRDRMAADEKKLKRIKRVLEQHMRDNVVTALTVDGEVVVRLSEFDRETVPVHVLREKYPAIAARLTVSTPVVQVLLP